MLNIAHQRLYNQQISYQAFQNPVEVVSWLGAVQAQDYAGAKWALGLRLQGFTDADIDRAFADGSILRTHVMRPTWHFVTPADIRWMLALTAPRVHAFNAYYYRKNELDETVFKRCHKALVKALEGGKQFTRVQVASVLGRAGVEAKGLRFGLIMMHAELDAVICSGARRGKQFTYALLDERVPQARTLERDEALAELTRRYFTSHGPALAQDFAWWSGLTTADARAGLDMCGSLLASEVVDGRTYWRSPASPIEEPAAHSAYLLPPFDEYGIAYKDHSPMLHPSFTKRAKTDVYGGGMVIDGQAIGYWRRTFRKGTVVIELAPWRALSDDEKDAFNAAAQPYGKFLGMSVTVS